MTMLTTTITRLAGTVGTFGAAALLFAGSAGAQGTDDRFYGHPMWDGGWWMLFGPVWMIVVIAAIVAAVVLVVRWLGGSPPPGAGYPQTGKAPIDILKERFARGEIDKEEFEDRRRLLE
jgi:putative membrane protein